MVTLRTVVEIRYNITICKRM